MSTLREIIYDIKESLNSYSDDSNISEEHIAFMVNAQRNLLLKQYMSNLKKEVPKEALQVICLDLERDEDCIDDKTVLASIETIPPTLENTGRSNIYNVYTVGARFVKNINIIEYLRLPYINSGKYKESLLYVAVDPYSKLIVYNTQNKHLMMEKICIESVFENPEEAYELKNDGSEECDFYDSEYPIESSMISIIKREIVRELALKYQIPTDEINDGEDNIQIPVRTTRRT